MTLLLRNCCVCGGPYLEDPAGPDLAPVCAAPSCLAAYRRAVAEAAAELNRRAPDPGVTRGRVAHAEQG